MRKIISFIFLFITLNFMVAQDIGLKISELKGSVDIKDQDGKWIKPSLNDVLGYNMEIYTGFHSQISLELAEETYITVNELSRVNIDNIRTTEEGITVEANLSNGYLVVFSKHKKNRIILTINKNSIDISNSGAEVYARKEKGTIISCFSGVVRIGTSLSKLYFLYKDEICGITPGGILIQNDYYLRRKINTKANSIIGEQQISAYYDLLFQNYTKDPESNDYSNNHRP